MGPGNRGGVHTHPRGKDGRVPTLQHVFQLLTGRGPAGCGWDHTKSRPLLGAQYLLASNLSHTLNHTPSYKPRPQALMAGPIPISSHRLPQWPHQPHPDPQAI